MRIGCPREIKNHEYRVGLTPANAKEYIKRGHQAMVEKSAGENAGFADADYAAAGCQVVADPARIYAEADMIIKVKEPLPEEYPLLRPGQILYTYLHLAASDELTRLLMDRKVASIGYETIEKDGLLPCLIPMSEIAGRLSVQQGAKYLERIHGGRGVLLGGVAGVERGKVAILGAGTVGLNAAKVAAGMGADVTVLDLNATRLRYVDDLFAGRAATMFSTTENLEKALEEADVVIGAVLLPGARAPRLVTRAHVARMKKGAVLVDVAVDQGGCMETTRPTTHADPVFREGGVVCYCVSNMPGAVPLTSTKALTNATLEFGLALANRGAAEACRLSTPLRLGLNTYQGHCTCQGVAEAHGLPFTDPMPLLRA